MTPREKLVAEIKGLPRLRFTPLAGEEYRTHFYLYATNGNVNWFEFDKGTKDTWPNEAWYPDNVIEIPHGAEPAEVATWIEQNWDRLQRLPRLPYEERQKLKVSLAEATSTRHRILGETGIRLFQIEWEADGRPGTLREFVLGRDGAVAEEDDFYGLKFIRIPHQIWDGRKNIVVHYWITPSILEIVSKRCADSAGTGA